jgi:hypothetical protein
MPTSLLYKSRSILKPGWVCPHSISIIDFPPADETFIFFDMNTDGGVVVATRETRAAVAPARGEMLPDRTALLPTRFLNAR